MFEQVLELSTSDGVMGVVAKHPDNATPRPVILMFHDGPGVRTATHEVVRRIAVAGYYVVAPDRYYRHGRFVHHEPEELIAAGPDSRLMRDFFAMVMDTTDEMVRADVDALLGHLASDPLARQGAMGCIGYCNGARSVLRAMDDHPGRITAGVGLHPSFCVSPDDDSPHLSVSHLQGHLYFAIGAADHLASVEHNQPLIDELSKLSGRAEVEILPGADHGFAVPGPNYHEVAAARAYKKALGLFESRVKLIL
jgi:carboxymethylenebutenolidase